MSSSDNNVETDIDIAKFASFRRKEIDLLNNESFLGKEVKHKSLFQLLPRHMRRRTMGYLRKRLPHRIRKAAIIKPPSKINKRPSRKYRRRPNTLLKEYERRKRATDDKMWLETHIWHAKRFHMSDSLYGYRLPVHDNCKGKRAVFKCLKQHSCIHDESYHVCHELKGRQDDLLNGLKRLCSQETGLTFAAKITLSGQCEGRTIIYEADKYPFNCIGPCRFIWKVENVLNNEEYRTLWIWSHPSIYKQVEDQLIEIFQFKKIESTDKVPEEEEDNQDSPLAKKRKIIPKCSNLNEAKPISNNQIPQAWSNQSNINLRCLKDKLVRFKLLGPLCTTILANVLKTIDQSDDNEDIKKQSELWNKIKFSIRDPNDIVSSTIFGLVVKDPRLILPKKKAFNKVVDQNKEIDLSAKNLLNQDTKQEIRRSVLSKSSIWDENVIQDLNKNKKSTHEINKIRENYLIPGTDLTKLESHSKIPILLVQNTLNNNFHSIKYGNFYSGWDLIIPQSWAMAFWTTFIHFGARAVGQNEMNYLLFESGNFQFPNEFFDTKASVLDSEKLKHDLYKKYLSKPPSKRVNYLKLGYFNAFYLPWHGVLKLNSKQTNETPECDEKFFILRNKKILLKLSNGLFCKNRQLKQNLSFEQNEIDVLEKSFIGVRLTSVGKGNIDQFSLLYGLVKGDGKEDENSILVLNKIMQEYKSDFVVNLKKSSDTSEEKKVDINKLLRNKFNKNEVLLNESTFLKYHSELIDSKTHKIPIGFVCTNGFTLINGKCGANAFINTKHILDLLNDKNVLDKTLLSYKTPSANLFRTAKINQFFI